MLNTIAKLVACSQRPPAFKGCPLATPFSDQREIEQCLGPHCQRVALNAALRAHATLDEHHRVKSRIANRKEPGQFLEVWVPVWVEYGQHKDQIRNRQEWSLPQEDVLPRFQVRVVGHGEPAGVLPLEIAKNLFRRHVRRGSGVVRGHWHNSNPKLIKPLKTQGQCPCMWSSRCQMPRGLYRVHAEVDQALAQGQAFLRQLEKEISDILGSVGTNVSMQKLLASCTMCWDWSHLVDERPTAAQVSAFLATAKTLRPFLQHTLWPDPTAFPHVQRTWQLTDFELCKQYLMLLQRVRRAGALATELQSAQRVGGLPPPLAQAVEAARGWAQVVG